MRRRNRSRLPYDSDVTPTKETWTLKNGSTVSITARQGDRAFGFLEGNLMIWDFGESQCGKGYDLHEYKPEIRFDPEQLNLNRWKDNA